jgi:DNA-directed RNA polymerase specialized sigma24 family protein
MTTETTKVDGFTRFVEETEPRLKLALCSAFGRQAGLDATADALESAWEHWDRVQGMANPQGYLWTVGRNRARRASSRRSLAFGSVVIDHMPWIEPGLPAALESLSEKQRVVVMLTDGYEWTHAEVAAVLGVSVGTVQRHKERALHRLRRALGVEE